MNSNNKPSSHNAKGKGKGNVKPKKDINEIATINVSDFNIVGDLNTNSFIVIDLKNISKYIVNREFLVNIDLVKLDSELFNYFVYFSLIKVLLTLKEQQNVITQIRELLVTIGIKKSVIKLIINEVMNFNVKTVVNKGGKLEGTNNRVIEKLFFKIEECASRRNATIDVNRLDKFLTLINGFLELDIKDLNIFIIDKIEQFVGQFENIANVDQVRSAQSRKKSDRTVPWTEGRYEKEFNAILKHFTREISDVIMKWLHKDNIIKFNLADKIGKQVNDVILDLSNHIAELLLNNINSIKLKQDKIDIDNNPLIILNKGNVISKIAVINKSNLNQFNNVKGTNPRDLHNIINIVNNINSMDALENRLNKLSSLNTPLMKNIKMILDDHNLTLFDKQVCIEKTLIEYEINYFKYHLDTAETRSQYLHKLYPDLVKGYNYIINQYRMNNYLKLKKAVEEIKNDPICIKLMNSKDKIAANNIVFNKMDIYNYIIILLLMYLGESKTISYSFSQLVSLLNGDIYDHKKTNITIILGAKIIKLFKYIKLDENKVLESIFPSEDLRMLLRGWDNSGNFYLGDSLLRIILDNTDIFTEDLVEKKLKDSYSIIRINDKFISRLVTANLNVLQLPMLTEPREIDSHGLYFPYINTDSTNLHLFEGSLIKSKHNQREETIGSELLYRSVNKLNRVKFKINKPMLNLVLEEWNNKDSIIFKGFNVFNPILETDTKEIQMKKMASNSKYQLYLNIINIASLYRDQEFYFPVFVDFRGRVYPLSHYLNYQGGDLARSLLLFANSYGEVMNDIGQECLNIYLANLAGYDKLSWNDRLDKVPEIIKSYSEQAKISPMKYVEANIEKISEPFQFLSIIVAKLGLMANSNTLVLNPILFDASCSGIQHIASLTLEKELASNVNVYSNSLNPEDDLPQDFYTYALAKISEKLLASDIVELRDLKLSRKIIKRSVMTIPYNISMAGVGEHISEHFETFWVLKERFVKIPSSATISGKEIVLTASQFGTLCKIIYFVLTKELPSLRLLSNYFDRMMDVFIKLNLPITWITPSGLKISYTSIKFESKIIKANLMSTSKKTTIRLPTQSLDKLSMKRSFMPNFIHSLDASNVHLLLDKVANLNLPVYTVHDCFASTPNNLFTLERLVKEAFINIYFEDEGYLMKLHKHLVAEIKSATDPIYEITATDEPIISNLSTINKNEDINNCVVDRKTNEIIQIPGLPEGYIQKNANLNDFIDHPPIFI